VDAARKDGANVVTGGERFTPGGAHQSEAYFYRPTILSNVKEGMRIVDEEQFGPVLPVLKYSDVDDAIERANDTEFGLGSSVWTADPNSEQALEVADRLEAGSTWINDHASNHESSPFGGMKGSGIGRENGGEIGLKEFVEMKTVKVTKKRYGGRG